jgi:predicted alpha-1,6-mannanase (GH76 family)
VRRIPITIFLLAYVITCATVVSGDDFNANTTTAITTLMGWYNANGLWTTTGWWNAANCVDAVEAEIEANNGQSYYPEVLPYTFALNSSTNFEDGFYDDEGWWTEAWIKAYDLTGNIQYLNMAKTTFTNITGGWDTTCSGGVWWDKTKTYKNAIANELFLLNAIRLHQRTPGDGGTGSFFYWATNEWSWFSKSGMINAQNLINDGLTNCLNNGKTTWTYNQGVILGGLVDLYKVTGNAAYLTQAETLATAATSTLVDNGVLQEPCEPTGCGGGDTPQFKGIFIRNLAYLYDVDHKAAWYTFMYNCAHSAWFNDNSGDDLGLKWTGPFDSADAARQSSAIMPISALAEPSTPLLFFAKGSGDPGFDHVVGQAAGTLAWSCNPATNNTTGFMQYGPYITSLPVGVHVVHYRLAVSALSNATANLMEIGVWSANSLVTSYEVAWNAFTAANQPQDFPLTFTNTVAGNALEFRVLWNNVSTAPTVTVSDITLDGSHNWTAANLAHNIGRLDGLDAWEADPIRDTASGYLTTGPGTPELSPGPYAAEFELKVDNFSYDNTIVATLSVVDADSDTVVASQSVARTEFSNTLYQVFSLNFQAVAGVHYNYCTYWNYATNAPRLTQRSVVVAPAGAAGFAPISLTAASYNQDMVVENTAPADPAGGYTTASMDAGVANTGNGWYEQGYDSSAPATGLPVAGSTITSQSASDHSYTFAPSYTAANDVAYVDSSHTASITPVTPTAYAALSFLAAAGHGPVIVDYTVHHADSTTETGAINTPDWFTNTPVAFDAQGRVNVVTGSFNNVNSNEPNLYAEDITLTNISSPVTQINLNWASGSTGSVAAIFAVSGLLPFTSPFDLIVTPLSQTQYVGAVASFSISASGTPPFTYQWQTGNSPIDGETNSTLTLSGLVTNETANYSCIVSNNGGSATSGNAALTVLPLPPFDLIVTPLSQTQYVGTVACFSVSASGVTPFAYQWQNGSSPINGATNSTLMLSGLVTNETANYSCIVSNGGGATTSGNAALTVLPLPTIQIAYSGGLVTLTWSSGVLLQSTNLSGPWCTNTAATSPFQVTPGEPAMFYWIQGQ